MKLNRTADRLGSTHSECWRNSAQLFGVFTGHGLRSGVVEADTAERALAYAQKCCEHYGMLIVSGPDLVAGRYSVHLKPKAPG